MTISKLVYRFAKSRKLYTYLIQLALVYIICMFFYPSNVILSLVYALAFTTAVDIADMTTKAMMILRRSRKIDSSPLFVCFDSKGWFVGVYYFLSKVGDSFVKVESNEEITNIREYKIHASFEEVLLENKHKLKIFRLK